MPDSQFQYTSNQNQFQNNYDERKTKGVGEGGAAGACAPALSKVGGGGAQVGLSPPTFERPSVLI